MLKASEANRIANNYQSYVKEKSTNYLEKCIVARAEDGFKWFSWNYGYCMAYDGLTANEKQEIISELQSAGYDAKDHQILKQIIIRW